MKRGKNVKIDWQVNSQYSENLVTKTQRTNFICTAELFVSFFHKFILPPFYCDQGCQLWVGKMGGGDTWGGQNSFLYVAPPPVVAILRLAPPPMVAILV